MVLIAVRFCVAFFVLNLIVLCGKVLGKGHFQFSLRGKPKGPILKLALCQPVIYFIAESYGIKYTSSSFAGIIVAMIPIAGVMVDAILMHSKIGHKQIFCAVLSVVGVALTAVGAKNLDSSALGLFMLLVSVVTGALFYVFSKQSAAQYSPLERTYVMFGIGSVAFLIPAIAENAGSLAAVAKSVCTPAFVGCILYLAVISSVVAFLLLNYGSSYVSVSGASLMANLSTVISIAAGVLILKESLSLVQFVGAVVILASVSISER